MFKTNWYKITFSLLLFSFYSGAIYGQEEKSDCVIKLEQAQSKYDQGRIQDVEPLIGDCLADGGFNKTGKTQALKLLTLSYLFLEEPEKAGETMLKLLHANHLFTVNPAIDPSEFINLYDKYRHEPIFNIGGMFGTVFGSPIITDLNGTPDLNNDSRQSYSPLLGIKGDLFIEYKFKPKLYLLGGFSFQIIEFEKTHESQKIISGALNGGFTGAEEVTSIEIPLLVQYHFWKKNKFTMYCALGVAPQLLLSESYQSDATTFEIDGRLVTTNKIVLTPDRNRFNISAIGIIGAKMQLDEGYINLRVRYSQQVLNSSNPENSLTPSNPNLLWELTDAYDGFRLQDIGFSVGYTRNIFIPKKLR